MKRKTPIRHKVQSYRRKGKQVDSYTRGKGYPEHRRTLQQIKTSLRKGTFISQEAFELNKTVQEILKEIGHPEEMAKDIGEKVAEFFENGRPTKEAIHAGVSNITGDVDLANEVEDWYRRIEYNKNPERLNDDFRVVWKRKSSHPEYFPKEIDYTHHPEVVENPILCEVPVEVYRQITNTLDEMPKFVIDFYHNQAGKKPFAVTDGMSIMMIDPSGYNYPRYKSPLYEDTKNIMKKALEFL